MSDAKRFGWKEDRRTDWRGRGQYNRVFEQSTRFCVSTEVGAAFGGDFVAARALVVTGTCDEVESGVSLV